MSDWMDDFKDVANLPTAPAPPRPTREEILARGLRDAKESTEYITKKFAEMDALDEITIAKVIAGEIKCPICHGNGDFVYTYIDKRFGDAYRTSIPCWCKKAKRLQRIIEEEVPSGYRHMAGDLLPCDKSAASIAFQQKVTTLVATNPIKSFAFFGPAGVGKTALSMWILIRRLRAINNAGGYPGGYITAKEGVKYVSPIYRSSASNLVRQHHAYITDDTGEADEPDITVNDITGTRRPFIMLTEVEKIGPMTDYKFEVMFTILDAMYEKRPSCQLIMDSNLARNAFEEYFTDKVYRRIAELCYVVDFFNETIQMPTDERMQ